MTPARRAGRRIRVAYLTPGLQPGGAERQMVILAGALPRDQFDVRFLAMSERGPLADQAEAVGARVHVLGFARDACRPVGPRCVRTAVSSIRRYRALTSDIDVVDAWLAPAMTFAVLAQPIAQVPVLVGGRRWLGDLYRPKPWYRRLGASIAARRMSAVVANSRAAADELIRADRVPAGRVHVIHNAVMPSSATGDDRLRLRNLWGWAEDTLVVGCVANYKPEKGLGALIDAIDVAHRAVPAIRAVIVGEGPLRGELDAEIRRRGLSSIIRLHGSEPDARPLYVAFDLFVQASESEGLPNVVLEAAAAGLPIVATSVGGTGEVLSDGLNGLLVRPRDPAMLAAAIERLARDSELRLRLAEAAHARSADYTVERLVAETASLYRRLVERAI